MLPIDARAASRPARASAAGLALLGYLLLITAVITLAPFRFAVPAAPRLSWETDPADMAANVLLFAPLGFVYRLALAPGRARRPRVAWGAALLVSATLEALQTFLPGRYPSAIDVLTNGAGAWLGALAHERIERRLGARLVRGLALELPLMNLVYLLVPLVWLDGLAMGREPARLWLVPPLVLFGGGVLVAVWRHRLRSALSANGLAGVAAGWVAVAAFPSLARTPGFVAACAAGLAIVVRLLARAPGRGDTADRRFEGATLRRLWPVYGAYVAGAALWPWPWAPGPWHAGIALVDLADLPGVVPVLRLLEHLAGFTLLGYMAAEARGRYEEGARRASAAVGAACLAAAGLLEAIRGFHPAHGASFVHLVLAAGVGLYGGLIYRLQLALVRRLLEAGEPAGAARGPAR